MGAAIPRPTDPELPRRADRRLREAPRPHRGGAAWSGHVSAALATAGFLFLAFLGFTVLAMGPLRYVDAYANLAADPGAWKPVLHVLDRIGQRAVCLPVLTLVLILTCVGDRSWRPAWLAAAAVFGLNLLVLILKLSFNRAQPATADPSFFAGGMAYPSGHTSNIILVYGGAVYLLTRYLGIRRRTQLLLCGLVALLSVTMVVVSLTLAWHWFADLIAGLLIGGVALELVVAADAALPARALRAGPVGCAVAIRDLVRARRGRERHGRG